MKKTKKRILLEYCKKRYSKNHMTSWLVWLLCGCWRGFLCRDNNKISTESCDVLILHPTSKSFRLKRLQKLIDSLKTSDVHVLETIALSEKQVVKKKACCGPFESGLLFRCYEGYANWLRKRYNPKIIITFRNGTVLSPFLKSKNNGDPITFHMAHSVLTGQSSRFDMLDYDYYCLYGKSSFEYLKKLSYFFGSCQIILGGSYLFDKDFVLPPANSKSPLLFLGMGPELEESSEGQKIYELVRDWQKLNKRQLYVRLHQRSKGEFWTSLSQKGIDILPVESFQVSASRASLVLSPYTNAVVDAALLGRPVQLVALPNEQDFLQVEKFFGPRVFDSVGLDRAIARHLNNYKESVDACRYFIEFHLEQGVDSLDYINTTILELLAGHSVSGPKITGETNQGSSIFLHKSQNSPSTNSSKK